MENTEILKAVGELRTTLEGKMTDFVAKDKVERIVEDVIKKLHPAATARQATPETPEELHERAAQFKRSPLNRKSKPWTSEVGKFYGDMRGYVMALKNNKAYVGNNEGTAGDGGNLVPTEFMAAVFALLNESSVIFQEANVLPMTSWKREIPVGATNPTVAWVNEAAAKTVVKPTFSKVTQQAKNLACIIEATDELLRDAAIDLQSFFAMLVAEAIDLEVERVALAGQVSGAGDPFNGVLYASGVVTVSMAAAAVDYDDFIELAYGGSQAYAKNSKIAISRVGLKKLMKLKNGAGDYIWKPAAGSVPATIADQPYFISSQIPANLGTGTDETAALFGNFGKYLMVSPREEMKVLASQHAYDPTNSISAFFNDLTFMRFSQAFSIDVIYGAAFRKLSFK